MHRKVDAWRQEIKPWGYHWDEMRSRQLTLERLKYITWGKTFQFGDNTCFSGSLRYTVPYGFHIKLSWLDMFFSSFNILWYLISLTCEVFLDRLVLTSDSNINFPFSSFSLNCRGILTVLKLGLKPRDSSTEPGGVKRAAEAELALAGGGAWMQGKWNKRKHLYWLRGILLKIKHWSQS